MYSIDTSASRLVSGHHAGTLSSTPGFLGHHPRGAPREHMDRDQDDSDQEQDPRNLDRDRGDPGEIQGAGNQADHQEH